MNKLCHIYEKVMKFDYTPKQKAFLDARGKVILNACPGSGKTAAIARKMMLLQDEYKLTHGSFRGIACLSFTNTAKNEINDRYTELTGGNIRYPNLVSTIDSFINKYITLPYYYLFVNNHQRPTILEDPLVLDDAWKGRFGFKTLKGQPLCYLYRPSSIRYESDGSFTFNGKKPDNSKVAPEVFQSYCESLKEWQINRGLITTTDSAFIAHQLLQQQPQIGKLLALRFPHIIIDEAQDNSALQHAIFDRLVELGLGNIEFIGDPYQSLFQWRDARPDLFINKFCDKENWLALDLTDNHRSPQRIIDCFSFLREQDALPISTARVDDKQMPVIVYRYNETNVPLIIDHYNQLCKNNYLKNNQIVLRGNSSVRKLLGKEAVQEPWKNSLPYKIIEARYKYEANDIIEAMRLMRSVAISLVAKGKNLSETKELELQLKMDHNFNSLLLNTLHNLPSFDLSIENWTTSTQKFLKESFGIEGEIDFEQKKRSYKGKFDKKVLKEPLADHFDKPLPKNEIAVTTVHQVKGKSLDSILVIFDRKEHPNNMTFSDIKAGGVEFPAEKQCIIYVALSRPKQLLCMAFPDKISEEKIKEKFGGNIKFISDDCLRKLNSVNTTAGINAE